MPASSLPTCNECLKDTMAVFATAASNKSQPLNLDYVTAAQQIARDCGPGFVNETIPDAGASGSGGGATSAAVVVGRPGWVLLVSVVMAIGVVGL